MAALPPRRFSRMAASMPTTNLRETADSVNLAVIPTERRKKLSDQRLI